jgi:hypothetical protein
VAFFLQLLACQITEGWLHVPISGCSSPPCPLSSFQTFSSRGGKSSPIFQAIGRGTI